MAGTVDIRIWNENTRAMDYFTGARIGKGSFGYNDNGTTQWVPIKEAMQKTMYDVGKEPIYEKDVIIYMGEPCMVFIDHDTHDAAVFYGDKKLFLKDIANDIELFTHVYENNEQAHIAIRNFKENIYKDYIKAEIRTIGAYNKDLQFGCFMASASDDVKVKGRYKFVNRDFGYAELYNIMTAMVELKLKGSKANLITIKVSNEFIADMINTPGILANWRKNGWKTKKGAPVKNSNIWNNILELMDGKIIEAKLMTEEERKPLDAYLKEK